MLQVHIEKIKIKRRGDKRKQGRSGEESAFPGKDEVEGLGWGRITDIPFKSPAVKLIPPAC